MGARVTHRPSRRSTSTTQPVFYQPRVLAWNSPSLSPPPQAQSQGKDPDFAAGASSLLLEVGELQDQAADDVSRILTVGGWAQPLQLLTPDHDREEGKGGCFFLLTKSGHFSLK